MTVFVADALAELGFVAVFVGIFVLAGLAIVAGGLYALYTAFTIWRSDPVTVREAAQEAGVDEFEGVVRAADETFEAPLSGEEAVLATYRVQKRKRSGSSRRGGSSSRWSTVTSGTITRPFLVEDGTGCALVDPDGADVSPDNEETRVKTGGSLPDEVRLRLSAMTDEFDDFGSVLAQGKESRRRYREGHIGPGDEVHIYGTQVTEHIPEHHGVDARVASAPDEQLYTISAGDERAVIRRTVGKGIGLVLMGCFFLGFVALFVVIALS